MRSPGVIVQRSLFQQVGRSMIMLVMLAMVVATAGANASPNNNQGSNDLITICKWTGQPGNGGEPHHNQRVSENALTEVVIEGETYYTFSDQHGSQWATEGPCDHDDDLPLERYCVDIEGDWTWVELPHAPSDYDPTGDECQPEPEELTWCVPDGDGGWTKQDHVDRHQPNDAVAPDSEGDCPEPNGRANTIWVCDTDTEYAYEIDEVRFDTDIHWEAEDGEECEHPVRIPDEVENPYCVYDDEQKAWLPALLTNEQVEGLDDDDIDPTGGLCAQDDNPGDDNPGDDNPGDDNPGDDNPGDDNPGGDATPITRVLDDTRVTSSGPETEVLSSETAAPAADELPRTGAEVPNLVVLALLLLTSGGWIIAIGRRTENA